MIHIIGSLGSMGKRYQSILRSLGRPFSQEDVMLECDDRAGDRAAAEGFIIASPTETHLKIIRGLIPFGKPILCEKPISKDTHELMEMGDTLKRIPFRMMYQYSELPGGKGRGLSSYDYFRTGKDGLAWDCLQIIGLSRGKIELAGDSPIWKCRINGKALNIKHMDLAYVKQVKRWLSGERQDMGKILAIHEKTRGFDAQ